MSTVVGFGERQGPETWGCGDGADWARYATPGIAEEWGQLFDAAHEIAQLQAQVNLLNVVVKHGDEDQALLRAERDAWRDSAKAWEARHVSAAAVQTNERQAKQQIQKAIHEYVEANEFNKEWKLRELLKLAGPKPESAHF